MSLFCVMLSRSTAGDMGARVPRQVFYLRSPTPEAALAAAVTDNPGWHVIGIEPESMLLKAKPAAAAPVPSSNVWDAA